MDGLKKKKKYLFGLFKIIDEDLYFSEIAKIYDKNIN